MNATQNGSGHPDPTIDWTIFTPAILLISTLGAGMIAWPEAGPEIAESAKTFFTGKLGWLYLVLGVSAKFGLVPWLPSIVAATCCGMGAVLFAYYTPGGSWRWGLSISSACWLFLGLTFIFFWTQGIFNWWPLIDALIVATVACAGGNFGRRMANRRA